MDVCFAPESGHRSANWVRFVIRRGGLLLLAGVASPFSFGCQSRSGGGLPLSGRACPSYLGGLALFLVPFSQAYPWATAVLVDELDRSVLDGCEPVDGIGLFCKSRFTPLVSRGPFLRVIIAGCNLDQAAILLYCQDCFGN
jgi:hypothetical protein